MASADVVPDLKCHCGATCISFSTTPDACASCHCKQCRALTSAPFINAAVWTEAKNVSVKDGSEHIVRHDRKHPDSGGGFTTFSCRKCGCLCYHTLQKAGYAVVLADRFRKSDGTLLKAVSPMCHLWYDERVVSINDDLPKYNNYPEAMGGDGTTHNGLPPGFARGVSASVPRTMHSVVCSAPIGAPPFGEASEKAVAYRDDVKTPSPGPGELLVRVLASSVNPIDWKIVSGQMKAVFPVKYPLTMGFDLAGVVAAVGSDVQKFKPGDAIYGDVPTLASDDAINLGSYAQYALISASKAGKAPQNATPSVAASLPVAAGTALQALRDRLLLTDKKGSSILILGASGGVGTAAVQIAKAFGLKITATCGGRNVGLVRSLGADVVLDYKKGRWDEVCDAKSFDGVFDCVGEKGVHERANKVLKDNGRFVSIANFDEYKDWNRGVMGGAFVVANTTGDFDQLRGLVEKSKLCPVIAREYPLDKVLGALQESAAGRVTGKIVLRIP